MFTLGALFTDQARDCISLQKNDPDYGITYEFICAATDNAKARAIKHFKKQHIVYYVVERQKSSKAGSWQNDDAELKNYCESLKQVFNSLPQKPDAVLVSEYQSKIACNFYWPLRTIGVRLVELKYEFYEMSIKANGGKTIASSKDRYIALQKTIRLLVGGEINRDPDNFSL